MHKILMTLVFLSVAMAAILPSPVYSQDSGELDAFRKLWQLQHRNRMIRQVVELFDPDNPTELLATAYRLVDDPITPDFASDFQENLQIVYAPGFRTSVSSALVSGNNGTTRNNTFDLLSTDPIFLTENVPDPSNGFQLVTRSFPSESYIDYLVSWRGYEVWIVDYVDDQASVEQNSLAIQQLLTNQLSSNFFTDPNRRSVMMGYSMGGLVARHALLSLDNAGINHNFSTYVSLDAPHRGAFLPPAIEAATRTLDQMADGGNGQVLLRNIEDETRVAIPQFNSDGAKELLGIYIRNAVPDMEAGWLGNLGKTNAYRNYETYYQGIVDNNLRGLDPSYFNLRENLADMGGYPSSTFNIGVTFGTESGKRLKIDSERPGMAMDWKVRSHTTTFARVEYNTTSKGWKLCRVEALTRSGRSCPSLRLANGHMEGVFSAPGSTIPIFKRIADGFDEQSFNYNGDAYNTALAALNLTGVIGNGVTLGLGALGAGVLAQINNLDFQHNIIESNGEVTFVPTASAFDDNGWAYSYLNDGQTFSVLDTPFDHVIGSSFETNLPHDRISHEISERIFSEIENRNLDTVGINRTSDPGLSSYFNGGSVFDVERYLHFNKTVRDLPLSDDNLTPLPRFPIPADAINALTAIL